MSTINVHTAMSTLYVHTACHHWMSPLLCPHFMSTINVHTAMSTLYVHTACHHWMSPLLCPHFMFTINVHTAMSTLHVTTVMSSAWPFFIASLLSPHFMSPVTLLCPHFMSPLLWPVQHQPLKPCTAIHRPGCQPWTLKPKLYVTSLVHSLGYYNFRLL